MTHAARVDFYRQRKQQFSKQLEQTQRSIIRISNLRLVTAVSFLIVLYFGLQENFLLYLLPIIVLAFAGLMKKHSKAFNRKVHLDNLVKINRQEELALEGKFSDCYSGSDFVDIRHPYSHDLDLFGEGSLFQFMNRAYTLAGRKLFVRRLTEPHLSIDQIKIYQEAAQELSALADFRQDFQATGMEISEQANDRMELKEWLNHPVILRSSLYPYVLWGIPALTFSSLILSFFIPDIKAVLTAFVLFQWAFLAFHIRKINAFHSYISRKKNILEKYSDLLFRVQQGEFTTPLLKGLSRQSMEAHQHVCQLASLVNALDARMNVMMNFVVNSLLLYDLQCVYRLEKWKTLYADKLEGWIDLLGEVEVLQSLGTFSFNHPDFCVPEIVNDLEVRADQLGHPLIGHRERICNDLTMNLQQQVLIVTGANMAGKSTFLRTVGVNLVLALMGAKVCAKSFRSPLLGLRTGMRTADSLKDHQSYFYAELNRLKSIMEELRSDKPLLILLDEILKGTNSTDKQSGSIALVRQLVPHPCLAIIATHDLVLGEMENEYPDKIRNYCFEATIDNDQLSFDYLLKPGLATKMNATFLMKKMGVIPP